MYKVVVLALAIFAACASLESYENKFEVTEGCLQYNSKGGYYYNHPYFSTAIFKNIHVGPNNVTKLRLGVAAKNDGHVRLAPVKYPYDSTVMNEIVLSGWRNTKSEVRRYVRTEPNKVKDQIVLKELSSLGMLSEYGPLMFTMAIHQDGLVELTKDGEVVPFLKFHDPKLSYEYISFCNWDVPAIYFFDCPLERDKRICEGVVFS
ncbi:uncharacterized protein LOC120414246 [Culex pipiens pallens]|uniref:uncharacterized protein LOC120414246 n=1 Tax=Culex pipiens pallens TaxID=42434 RepID=UPI0019538221|nr:uncharacterized protein LOC120414246 [Culex pipiens pallens]